MSGNVEPRTPWHTPEKNSKQRITPSISARVSLIALPLSRDSSSVSAARCSSISSAIRQSKRARSGGETRPHGPSNADRAALTARSTSTGPASATEIHGSPVLGSIDSNVAPSLADAQPPSMNNPSAPEAVRAGASRSIVGAAVDMDTDPVVVEPPPGHIAKLCERSHKPGGLSTRRLRKAGEKCLAIDSLPTVYAYRPAEGI